MSKERVPLEQWTVPAFQRLAAAIAEGHELTLQQRTSGMWRLSYVAADGQPIVHNFVDAQVQWFFDNVPPRSLKAAQSAKSLTIFGPSRLARDRVTDQSPTASALEGLI